jgi:putative hemolysin
MFSTLKSAYQFAGEAGVSRLKEKYPESGSRLDFWETRWSSLVVSLNLVTIFLRLGFVTLLLYGLLPLFEGGALFGFAFLTTVTLIVWIFCYLIPLAIGDAFSDRISMQFLPMVGILTRLLSPVSQPLSFFQKRLANHFLEESDGDARPTAEDEIRTLVDQADEEHLEEEEREMIRSIFELGDTVAREIMTPRVDVVSIEDTVTVDEATDKIRNTAHSRFPVYTGTMDEILGTVHIKDLLNSLSQGNGSDSIRSIAKPIAYVPETMPIQDLLGLMQSQQNQIALVVDEYGGTAGLVTMEDIIEEIVGEIHDEFDSAKLAIQTLSESSYLVDGRLNLEELNDQLKIEISTSEEYDSLAGYMLHEMGHIPAPGEQVNANGHILTVKSSTPQQITTVQIDLKSPPTIPTN